MHKPRLSPHLLCASERGISSWCHHCEPKGSYEAAPCVELWLLNQASELAVLLQVGKGQHEKYEQDPEEDRQDILWIFLPL